MLQSNDVETESLNHLLPDLTRLKTLVADEGAAANRNAILALRGFSSYDDLAELEELLAEAKPEEIPPLDFFDVLGIYRPEAVHSDFLGWLLHPSRDHRTGDHFLRDFLQETAAQAESLGISVASPAELAVIDWASGDARREDLHIDILIVNPAAQFLCAIENKIWAPEGDGQLSGYRKVLEDAYPDYTRHYVFLTPDGRESQEKAEREFWAPVGYATILELVEQIVADQSDSIGGEVHAALQFYATALRRHIVPEATEVQRLAREIYIEHSGAIEMIYQHKPDIMDETEPIFRQAVAQHLGWMEEVASKDLLRFSPKDWSQFDFLSTGTGWGNPGPVLLFEIDYRQGHPRLVLTLGPGTDEPIRSKIHTTVSRHGDVFSRAGQPLNKSYTRLDEKRPVTEIADFRDEQQLRDKIMAWVASFAADEFPRMNAIIMQAFCEHESVK